MKNLNRIILGVFILITVTSLVSVVNANAVGDSNQVINVNGDSIQTQLQSNIQTTFQFREMTRLTICTNVNLELGINCEAQRIAEKDFILELEGDNNLQMIMTCTKEEAQLGLMDGNIVRARSQNTYRYQEGFCIALECVCGCQCQSECQYENECQCICNCGDQVCFTQARLRIRITSQNRLGNWAYYDENSEKWVIVHTTIDEGYLTATTDHFSTWTILIPTNQNYTVLIIGSSSIIAFIGIIIGISVLSYKKRR
ncbi:MAG: hypothetical protein ACFFDF_06230 [Candidatus Odinarchaeota archaeon]